MQIRSRVLMNDDPGFLLLFINIQIRTINPVILLLANHAPSLNPTIEIAEDCESQSRVSK